MYGRGAVCGMVAPRAESVVLRRAERGDDPSRPGGDRARVFGRFHGYRLAEATPRLTPRRTRDLPIVRGQRLPAEPRYPIIVVRDVRRDHCDAGHARQPEDASVKGPDGETVAGRPFGEIENHRPAIESPPGSP